MSDTETLTRLTDLAFRLSEAKLFEERAKATRISLEEQIAALIPGPEKGQKSVKLADGTKITVERGFNYRADLQAIEKLFSDSAHDLPETWGDLHAPVKAKATRELDEKGYEWYRKERPEVFAQIAQHVAATPKKVSVTLKVEGR